MADHDEIQAAAQPQAPPPRGRTSLLTKLIIAFNLLAAILFAFTLYLDIGKRQMWARAVLLRDLAIVGLPVDDKDAGTKPEAAGQPKHDLDPPLIKDAYKARGGKLNDKFMEVRESFKIHIPAADLDQNTLTRYFSEAGAGNPVSTLKDEVGRLKAKLPGEINNVAQEVADKAKAKAAAEKRGLLQKILFPVCTEGWQISSVEDRIQKTPDEKLDELLVAAAKRRMWFDILQAMEIFRPSEKVDLPDPEKAAGDLKLKKPLVDRAAELDEVSIDQLAELFAKRCDQVLASVDWIDPSMQRDNFEKRRCVAFLLVTVSQVEVPGADQPDKEQPIEKDKKVQPKGKGQNAKDKGLVHFVQEQKDDEKKEGDGQPEQKVERKRPQRPLAFAGAERRAEAVCGFRDFDQACEDLAIVTEIIERQTAQAIDRDLGNFHYPLAVRVYDSKKFADELVGVMQKMKIAIPNEETFRKAVEAKLTDLHEKIDDSAMLRAELKKVMAAQQVLIPEDAKVSATHANKATFELAVDALLSANAIGFLGKYHMAVKRLQNLAFMIESRERQFKELKDVSDERQSLLQSRTAQEKDARSKLLEDRAKTRQLALDLKALQDQLFLAQDNVRSAHEYVLYLAQRLKETERMLSKSKGGAGQ